GWRLAIFDESRISGNDDANQHIIQTVRAFDRVPVRDHLFLPIMNLGAPEDAFIPRGAAVPDGRGNIFYTSFLSAGFLAAWAFFKITGLPPNSHSLFLFGIILHALSTALLFFLLWRLFDQASPLIRGTICVLGVASFSFASELMYSHGPVYWHQTLFQAIWL